VSESNPRNDTSDAYVMQSVMPKSNKELEMTLADASDTCTAERLESFLRVIDRDAAREGLVRTPIKLGEDSDGSALGIIAWRKP
jgi:hypothetical protein